MIVTIKGTPPRWGKSYLTLILGLARLGVSVNEDAAIERVKKATLWEMIDEHGERHTIDV